MDKTVSEIKASLRSNQIKACDTVQNQQDNDDRIDAFCTSIQESIKLIKKFTEDRRIYYIVPELDRDPLYYIKLSKKIVYVAESCVDTNVWYRLTKYLFVEFEDFFTLLRSYNKDTIPDRVPLVFNGLTRQGIRDSKNKINFTIIQFLNDNYTCVEAIKQIYRRYTDYEHNVISTPTNLINCVVGIIIDYIHEMFYQDIKWIDEIITFHKNKWSHLDCFNLKKQ